MPIWDYDSGLYWTGYYTTDPYHKKNYRDLGRFLYLTRKAYLPYMISKGNEEKVIENAQLLKNTAKQVAYLQHHDGISGTSKYSVMDELETENQQFVNKIK